MPGPRSAPAAAVCCPSPFPLPYCPWSLCPWASLLPFSLEARFWGPQQLTSMERGNLDPAQDHIPPWWGHFWGLGLGLLVSCVGDGKGRLWFF